MHENAGTVNTTIDIATINYLPKRFRFLSGGFRHDWARKRAQQLLLKLQEAMAAQQKPAAIGLGAMVSKIMGHTKGELSHHRKQIHKHRIPYAGNDLRNSTPRCSYYLRYLDRRRAITCLGV